MLHSTGRLLSCEAVCRSEPGGVGRREIDCASRCKSSAAGKLRHREVIRGGALMQWTKSNNLQSLQSASPGLRNTTRRIARVGNIARCHAGATPIQVDCAPIAKDPAGCA